MSNVAAGKDIDDEGEKLNDVEKALGKQGIQLRKATGEWRNFEEVLDEVAGKWKSFTEIQQSQVATAIAGTRQQELFRSLMANYDQVGKLVDVAANSTGSASERMEIYLNSVEAKVNNVKAAWENLILELNQSESYKSFLDIVTFLIENLPRVVSMIASLYATIKAFSIAKQLNDSARAMQNLQKIADTVTTSTIANTTATNTNTTAKNLNKTASIGLTSTLGALSTAIGIVTAAFSIGQMIILAYDKHLSDLGEQVEESARKVEAVQQDINSVANAMGDISSINSQYEQGLITIQEKTDALKTIEDELNSIYEAKIGHIDLINRGYEEQIGLLNDLQSVNLNEQLAEAQKGESARKELLDRHVSTTIGETKDIDSLSSESTLKMWELVKANNLTWKEGVFNGHDFLEGSARDLKEFTNALEEYQQELIATKKTEEAQKIGNILSSKDFTILGMGYKGMKNENETTGDALEKQNEADFLEFQIQNQQYLNEYSTILRERKNLVEKYNKEVSNLEELQKQKEDASTAQEKKTLDTKIKNTKNEMAKYYDLLIANNDKYQIAKDKVFGLTTNEDWIDRIKEQYKELENVAAFKTDNVHLDKLQTNYQNLYKTIKELDDAFEKGQISSKQYFDGLNQQIKNIDTKNLDEMKTKIESFLGNNISYLDSFMGQLFNDTITDAQDVQNLQAYTSNMKELINLLKEGNAEGGAFAGQINKEIFEGISKESIEQQKQTLEEQKKQNESALLELQKQKAELEKKEFSGMVVGAKGGHHSYKYSHSKGAYDVTDYQGNIMPNYGFAGSATRKQAEDEGYKQYNQELEKLDNQIEATTESQKNLNDEINNLESSEGLDEYQSQLEEIGEVLGDMDIEKTQDAFDTLSEAIEDGAINGDAITSIEKLPEKYRSAFLEVSNDIVYALGSTNEEVRKQAQASLETLIGAEEAMAYKTVDFANLTQEQITAMSTEIANKTIIAQGGVTNALQAFATEGNRLASTAMGQAVQTLGIMLEEIGKAIEQVDIRIPIKIPNVQVNLAGVLNGEPVVKMEGTQDSEITIGGAGTSANVSGLANVLKNADYADAFGKLMGDNQGSGAFNPYTFNPSGKKDTGSGGSGKKGSGGSSGSKNTYSPEDAASDLKDILQDIEDYESDIEVDLQDQTEELINHYNLEKNKLDLLREQLDYYDGIYDVTENTSKWLDTQLKILDEESKKTSEIYESNKKIADQREKIYNENSGYNVRSWFDEAGNETLAYGDLLNSFEYKKEAIQKEIAQRMRAEYNAVANSTDKDTISAAKDRIKQIEEEGDLRIKEIEKEQEKVENIYDSVSQLNDAWKENEEAIRDALTELNDRIKSIRDELIDDLMEQLETAVDKMNKSIEKDATRLEQLRDIQESYNDILNDTLDTQDELASELQANMDSYEYLDETMRQLMFNEDDYKELNEVLTGIQEDITNIWEDHYNQIQGLSEEEMYKAEYITSETERQLAAKQKEYDLAKAELDVAKAQTNLQNVLNERNQRVFVNGQWQWVADNEAVRDARQQLADAEREKDRIEREQLQQEQLDYLDRLIDSDNLQIDKNNELLEMIQEAIELQTQEVKSIEEALNNIKDANLPAINDLLVGAVGADGGYLKKLLGEINHSQLELAAALRGQSIAQAQNALKTNQLSQTEFQDTLNRLGYTFDPNTGEVVTQDGRFKAHYKGWSAPRTDVQTGTAANGVQVTGQQAGSGAAAAATSGGGGGGSQFPKNGRVTTSSSPLRIRSGAGTQYKVLGLMPRGANVTILGEANSGWAQVKYGGITGYSSRQYLSYDQGGIAEGIGLFSKATLKPERILSPRQTKAFENLSKNLISNPVLNALTRVPNVQSHLDKLNSSSDYSKKYFFSNFTIQANDIEQFINSIETIMPTNK